MVAVTKKQVEELEVAEMKMLRFATGVTRKDKIKNKYIRGTLKGRTVRKEDEGEQAKVVWTCHEERPGVCRKKDDGNGVTRKEEKRAAEEKISGCSEKGMGEVDPREKDIQNRTCVETLNAVATPD